MALSTITQPAVQPPDKVVDAIVRRGYNNEREVLFLIVGTERANRWLA